MTEPKKDTTTAGAENDINVEESADVEAPADPVEDAQSDAETKNDTEVDKQIDYKALAEKLRLEKEKAEKALAERRFKQSKEKRESSEDETSADTDDDKPLTKKELQNLLVQRDRENEKRLNEARALEIAKQLSTNNDEVDYALAIFRDRQFPSYLTLEEQVEESFAIANSKRIIGQRNEALRAARSKDTVSKSASGSAGGSSMQRSTPKISSADSSALIAAGFTFNTKAQRYEKKLGDGRTLVRDPKTKQTVILPRA